MSYGFEKSGPKDRYQNKTRKPIHKRKVAQGCSPCIGCSPTKDKKPVRLAQETPTKKVQAPTTANPNRVQTVPSFFHTLSCYLNDSHKFIGDQQIKSRRVITNVGTDEHWKNAPESHHFNFEGLYVSYGQLKEIQSLSGDMGHRGFEAWLKKQPWPVEKKLRVKNNWYIAKYHRVWIYDSALGIESDLKAGRIKEAKAGVDALIRLAKYEKNRGFKGLWHFSYNTVNDNFCDPRGPLGANLWAINAIFSYILKTGDKTHLDWVNKVAMKFIFDQQVMEKRDKRYGLVRGGLYNKVDAAKANGMGYHVYEGNPNVQNEACFIEHNADAASTFRLAYLVNSKKKGFKNSNYAKELTRRHTSLIKAFDKFWVKDHYVTGMNADGSLNKSVAVDNNTWVASVVLPYNEERAWQCVEYTMKKFHTLDQDVNGLFFFNRQFKDPYVNLTEEDKSKIEKMVQPEATFGFQHLLMQIYFLMKFASSTKNSERAEKSIKLAQLLFAHMVKAQQKYKQMNDNPGTPYATKDIKDLFNTGPSMAATATGVPVAYEMLNFLLSGDKEINQGAIQGFIGVFPPQEFKVDGKAPTVTYDLSLKHEPPKNLKCVIAQMPTPITLSPQFSWKEIAGSIFKQGGEKSIKITTTSPPSQPKKTKKAQKINQIINKKTNPVFSGISFNPSGAGGNVAGKVKGLKNPANYKVLVFTKTDTYYLQNHPQEAGKIKSDGAFSKKGLWPGTVILCVVPKDFKFNRIPENKVVNPPKECLTIYDATNKKVIK